MNSFFYPESNKIPNLIDNQTKQDPENDEEYAPI